MRSSVALSLFLVAATSPLTGAQKPAGVSTPGLEWQVDLAAAHAASARDGKPVVAYFTFET